MMADFVSASAASVSATPNCSVPEESDVRAFAVVALVDFYDDFVGVIRALTVRIRDEVVVGLAHIVERRANEVGATLGDFGFLYLGRRVVSGRRFELKFLLVYRFVVLRLEKFDP
ncbi:hypothetical protein [Halorussus ruber]|uniref:hypothetical protein n=1 Tax=Halorussus ruber TaxID=1126238 RepID=UPI001091EF8B|nr:hypothetical protein [Halorussus ruber]